MSPCVRINDDNDDDGGGDECEPNVVTVVILLQELAAEFELNMHRYMT